MIFERNRIHFLLIIAIFPREWPLKRSEHIQSLFGSDFFRPLQRWFLRDHCVQTGKFLYTLSNIFSIILLQVMYGEAHEAMKILQTTGVSEMPNLKSVFLLYSFSQNQYFHKIFKQ